MGRLIDADVLAEDIKNINFTIDLTQIQNIIPVEKLIENVVHNVAEIVMEHIKNQPTAYDVNCVLDALERKSFEAAGFVVVERKTAIDIIRKGGKAR